jgi:Alg9-like mannosyltransferase family
MGIRNTSIIGWIPLLLFKMVEQRAFKTFIRAGILIAVPTMIMIIVIDSLYYGQLTCTAYNFLVINVFDNRSAEFGVESSLKFVTDYIP